MTSDRKTIIVASHNPVKLNATIRGFERMFPGENFKIEGADIASLVSNQPLSDAETYRGALNRAQSAARIFPAADYWVGIEGGRGVRWRCRRSE
jgi:inosine/xanthosine triphosphatase